MIATNYKPKIQKTVLNPTAPVARVRDMMLIDFPHPIQIPFRYRPRRVITAGARQSEQPALAAHRQRVLPVDHRLALAPSIRPSADSKKSFSIVSFPILACSSATVGPGSDDFFPPREKTSSACDSNCCFPCTIWFGWT